MTLVAENQAPNSTSRGVNHEEGYVTVYIDEQIFGIPVLKVQDILSYQPITRVPLAPPEIAGSLNLRGRVVTAVDVRKKLGLPAAEIESCMNVVVEAKGELYSLMVDKVGEVLSLPVSGLEKNPPTMDDRWKTISSGVYRLDGHLLLIANVDNLLFSDS